MTLRHARTKKKRRSSIVNHCDDCVDKNKFIAFISSLLLFLVYWY